MKDRETLDQAIDRVAARMSAGGPWQGVDLPALPPRGLIVGLGAWRWAVVAAFAIALTTALVVFGPDRHGADVIVATAPTAQPGTRFVAAVQSHAAGIATDAIPPIDVASRSRTPQTRARAEQASMRQADAADFGLEAIADPAVLDLAPMSVPALNVTETQGIEPVTVPRLAIDPQPASPDFRK